MLILHVICGPVPWVISITLKNIKLFYVLDIVGWLIKSKRYAPIADVLTLVTTTAPLYRDKFNIL